ncbi:MAG: permease-like cell division protein FtsX [Clostridiales bacterium]|jgi:cell division transport system permease protein|nr:permease-like cell division protein FtsX [Clostridiales bacterium]
MSKFIKNGGYFFREIKTIFMLNKTSSILSLVSLTMIFFILMLTVSGWWMSNTWMGLISDEAEISVYYVSGLNPYAFDELQEDIEKIDGVNGLSHIEASEAYDDMEKILGGDAKVLESFTENPFDPYFELSFDFENRLNIVKELNETKNVSFVRDNQDVLDQLENIIDFIEIIGIVVGLSVSISTFIITSHIIREGIHSNREHIRTLRLLGAPTWFINFPFVTEGILITGFSAFVSGLIFTIFSGRLSNAFEGTVQFLPALDMSSMTLVLWVSVTALALLLGMISSAFGLKLVSKKK